MQDQDYDALAKEIVKLMEDDPTTARQKYGSPDTLVMLFPPYHPFATPLLREAVRKRRSNDLAFPFGVREFDAALSRWRTRYRKEEAKLEAEAQKASRMQDIETFFGGVVPKTEREYVTMMMHKRGYDMTYDRRFFKGSSVMRYEAMLNDLHLTAGDLGLVKPRGDLLGSTNIDRALTEWADLRKLERKQIVADRLAVKLTLTEIVEINNAFVDYCTHYFAEPDYAEACIRKFIWQVKRRLFGLPVNQIHFFTTIGSQNTGKTYTAREMLKPVGELSAECSLQDALDDRQMDLPQMFILFIDELARLDKTDSASLKTFITGEGSSRRPMRTNATEKIDVNASLFATSNMSLDMLMFDNSGMRRQVEIHVKKRHMIEPFWDKITEFDWMTFWQSINVDDDDPLISKFKDRLMNKQEDIRSQSNTEVWLRQFNHDMNREYYGDSESPIPSQPYHRKETLTNEKAEFFAGMLYLLFKEWETVYDFQRKTSITSWGREMKNLIRTAQIAGWDEHKVGTKQVYVWDLPREGAETGNAVVPVSKPADPVVSKIDEWRKRRSKND